MVESGNAGYSMYSSAVPCLGVLAYMCIPPTHTHMYLSPRPVISARADGDDKHSAGSEECSW